VLCDGSFNQFFTNQSPTWPAGGEKILQEIAQALDSAVEEFGDEVHRDYRGQWPGFGGAHDFINPQFFLILLNLSSAATITAASRALIGYMRERRSDISLKVGDVEIEIKRSKDVAADIARITEILGPELAGRDIQAERINVAKELIRIALNRGVNRSKILADLEKAEAENRIDRVSADFRSGNSTPSF
jgi:hypothetical protein